MYMEILDYVVRIAAIFIFTVAYRVIKEYDLERLVRSLVYAAEKYKELGGEEKYNWVKSQVAKKMKVDEEKLDILIESFVSEINAQKKNKIINNNVFTERE